MQKRTSLILCFLFAGFLHAQSFIEDFDDVPTLFSNGWTHHNNSSPFGSGDWRQDFGNFNPPPTAPDNSSIVCDFTSVASGQSGDISNWLITPTINFTSGDSIVFFTRSFNNGAYPDRMEVRLNRTNTTNVGSSTTSVGDFDTTFLVINPTLTISSGGYPMIWSRYAFEITGVLPSTPCRLGFRYFVTDGGQTGNNGSTIGIDHFEYKSLLTGIDDQAPLHAFIQLANGQLSIEVPEATHPFSVELMDISGKLLVKGEFEKSTGFDLNTYSNGIYLVKILYEGKYLIKKISF
jgi:hypothetical protein